MMYSYLFPICYLEQLDPPTINLLNAELNPICHLLALLGAHYILHVSGIRVKTREMTDELGEVIVSHT